jgi:hypothetical protein
MVVFAIWHADLRAPALWRHCQPWWWPAGSATTWALTTGDTCFPECQMHSGKAKKHSGKPSSSATLGEEPLGMPFTGKRSSPSAKNRTLGEAFPECHPNTRGRFNAVGAVRLFFWKPLPPVQHSGKKFVFFIKILFPKCNRGRNSIFLKKFTSLSASSQALGEEIS